MSTATTYIYSIGQVTVKWNIEGSKGTYSGVRQVVEDDLNKQTWKDNFWNQHDYFILRKSQRNVTKLLQMLNKLNHNLTRHWSFLHSYETHELQPIKLHSRPVPSTLQAWAVYTPGLCRLHSRPGPSTLQAWAVYTPGLGRIHSRPVPSTLQAWASTLQAWAVYTPGLGRLHSRPGSLKIEGRFLW